MAVDDYDFEIGNLQDLFFDKVEKESSSYASWLRSFNELSMPESQLCVPPDPIEDLELFPNFHGDFISLNDVMPQNQSHCFTNELSMPESQLCVPPDPIENLEWFPNFHGDFISLNDAGFMPQCQSHCFVNDNSNKAHENQHLVDFPVTPEQWREIKAKQNHKEMGKDHGIEPSLHGFIGFARKKARTKNHRKPRWRAIFVRKRCSHCQTEETPLWRNGPLGPKTLCNACGVRFRSGRLVAEYRPAASPTFDSTKHSNYHRKIVQRLSVD